MKLLESMSDEEIASMNITIKKAEDILTKIRICEGCKVLAGTQNFNDEPRCFKTALKIFENVKNELVDDKTAIAFTLLRLTQPDMSVNCEKTMKSLNFEQLTSLKFDNCKTWKDAVEKAFRDTKYDNLASKLDKARIVIGFDAQLSPNQVPLDTIINAENMLSLFKNTSNRQAIQDLLSIYIDFKQESIDAALADCVMD